MKTGIQRGSAPDRALAALGDGGWHKPDQVARKISYATHYTREVLRKLERAGLVERARQGYRRLPATDRRTAYRDRRGVLRGVRHGNPPPVTFTHDQAEYLAEVLRGIPNHSLARNSLAKIEAALTGQYMGPVPRLLPEAYYPKRRGARSVLHQRCVVCDAEPGQRCLDLRRPGTGETIALPHHQRRVPLPTLKGTADA